MCFWRINVKKCIRMGINIFKIFIRRGISSFLWLTRHRKKISAPQNGQYTSPNENFEYSYPLSMCTANMFQVLTSSLLHRFMDDNSVFRMQYNKQYWLPFSSREFNGHSAAYVLIHGILINKKYWQLPD